ncbi:flagellar export protein FliJ [Pseudomonas oryzihabitans]|uniref:Flagellar FliJ protein n=1 Tax=Pseudomonas oryzihabitans TaxID=47885 RepID=A0AAJ2BN64_9PSED|nr:flagellar export protein FliJ [Pseudomonas psychrotolerans]MDR6236120.1 flagellar FliJ protein [Pseudomonas psychrotolerans]MDR6354558.1 flagellar FliJ protein [Pseudomonas psychrotolerans]QDD88936.1 flagellar protein FliJ [Pseudomonas psychrotolerans]
MKGRAERLGPVVEMSEREERDAAQRLGQCQQQLAQAEFKLGELQRYREDYQQRLVVNGSRGVTGQWLIGYQRFLSQLEEAIGQQERNAQWHRDVVAKARTQWQERYARLEGLRKLVERYKQEQRLVEDKREQKQMDEYAQRARSAYL